MSNMAKVIQWMAGRDTGMSSMAIATHMSTGICSGARPYDPADLGRCLRLLEQFPEWKARLPEMGAYNDTWASYAAHWDELHDLMAEEVGIDWSKGKRAERTYRRMKELEAVNAS